MSESVDAQRVARLRSVLISPSPSEDAPLPPVNAWISPHVVAESIPFEHLGGPEGPADALHRDLHVRGYILEPKITPE